MFLKVLKSWVYRTKKKVWCGSKIFIKIELMGPHEWYYVKKVKKTLGTRPAPGVFYLDPNSSKSMYFQCIFDKIDQVWVSPVSEWRLIWTCKLFFLVTFWVDFGLMDYHHQELLHCHGWPLSKTHVPEKENQDLLRVDHKTNYKICS